MGFFLRVVTCVILLGKLGSVSGEGKCWEGFSDGGDGRRWDRLERGFWDLAGLWDLGDFY